MTPGPVHAIGVGVRPQGQRTAARTLSRMAAVVARDGEQLDLINTARGIVDPADGRDYPAQLRLLDTWLREHTRFQRDPVDDELLQSPRLMLAHIARDGVAAGDCDDVAMLAAALAKAVGFRTKFVAESYRGPDAPFQHVYTVALLPTGWRALDVQRPANLHFPALRRIEHEA